MEPNNNEIDYQFLQYFRVYKDGRVEKLQGTEIVPPPIDPTTGISSKDIIIESEYGISARLYLPKITHPNQKFPLLIHYHGGGFCIGSPFHPFYTNFLKLVAAEANIVIVSVDYRLVPEHYLPIAYEDSWVALKWVFSHSKGQGSEIWLNDHVNFDSVFLAGESAGANITHNMAIRAGTDEEFLSSGFKITGIALIHPYFTGIEPIGSEMNYKNENGIGKAKAEKIWLKVCPLTTGCDDPLINPEKDPNLSRLGCIRVLVFVAGKDGLRDRGLYYYNKVKESGWGGVMEIMETEGEGHVFHLLDQNSENSVNLRKRLVSFLIQKDEFP